LLSYTSDFFYIYRLFKSSMSHNPRIKYSLQLFFLFFAVSAPVRSFGYGLLDGKLPEDERTALLELEQGTIDSAFWELLRPFYAQPLSIPLGELRYLRDVLPDLPEDLPSQPEVLSRYEPWTDESICAFFRDFPYLVQFRPILSFDVARMPSFAHVSFFSHALGISHQSRQSVRFNVYPFKNIRADGTVCFQQEYARWQRRRLLLAMPGLGKLHAGNFSFTINNGLFYGYFPAAAASHDDLAYNWLYGESRTWNGFLAETRPGAPISMQALFHTRSTESIAGFKTAYTPAPFLALVGAFTGALAQVDSGVYDTAVNLHGGIEVSAGLLTLNIQSGVNMLDAGAVPVSITVSNNENKQRYSLSFVRIPQGFSAPRSSLLHTLSSRFGTDRQTGDITGFDFLYAGSFSKYFAQELKASYIAMQNSANMKASVAISGSLPFKYDCTYWLEVNNHRYDSRHRFKVVSSLAVIEKISVSPSVTYYIKSDTYWRIMADVKADCKPVSMLLVSPFVTYCATSLKGNDLVTGFVQRIVFFEKTYIEIKCIIPVISQYNEKYSLYANAHFLF